MTNQHECAHQWQNHSGEPLACIDCGLPWPGVDDWPPEPLGHVESRGEHRPWGRRVDAMLQELAA